MTHADTAEALAARRQAATDRICAETGIDEAMIDRLVETFYARVRDDALLGRIFADHVADWEPHLAQMKLFWSSVALSTGVYQGRPMPKHLPLPIDGPISTAGWPCLRRPRSKSARRSPQPISWSARAGSPKASNWASPMRTRSCSAWASASAARGARPHRVCCHLLSADWPQMTGVPILFLLISAKRTPYSAVAPDPPRPLRVLRIQ